MEIGNLLAASYFNALIEIARILGKIVTASDLLVVIVRRDK